MCGSSNSSLDPGIYPIEDAEEVDWSSATYMLGAGFSRALSSSMPLLSDLNSTLRPEIERELGFVPGDIEETLTYLAEPPPYVTEAERLERLALYERMTSAVASSIILEENIVLNDLRDPPGWLAKLIRLWHDLRSTVVTFNYDTLIERAARDLLRPRPNDKHHAFDEGLLYSIPTAPVAARQGYGLVGSTPVETFRLLKLHGSTSWLWSRSAEGFGEMIHRSRLSTWPHTAVEEPEPPTADGASRLVAGLSIAIVPPVHSKGSLVAHPLLRAQWEEAARRSTRRNAPLVVMGYSLPAGDLATRHMLREHLRDRPLLVADPNPDVAQSFFDLFDGRAAVYSAPDIASTIDLIALSAERLDQRG